MTRISCDLPLQVLGCHFHRTLSLAVLLQLLAIGGQALAQCSCPNGSRPNAIRSGGMFFPGRAAPRQMTLPPFSLGLTAGVPFEGDFPTGIPGQIIDDEAIYLTVNVPEEAIVTINNDPTISDGPTRHFVVRHVEPDRAYKFVIVAETANPAGIALEQTKTVTLKPGEFEEVTLEPFKRKMTQPSSDSPAGSGALPVSP